MNVYAMIQEHKEEINRDLETINSWKKDGKRLNISALDIMNAIAATVNAINDDIKTAPEIFHAGNGKIDSSVLCQSIAAVLSCGCHCKNCYAANCMTGAHGDKDCDSAIMWLSGDYKTRYAFAKEIGTCEQPYDRESTEDHFCTILAGGGLLVARGAARRGYGFCD